MREQQNKSHNTYFSACLFSKEFDETIPTFGEGVKPTLLPSIQVYRQASRLFIVWQKGRDVESFVKFCRYLILSLESESPKLSYVGIALNKDYVLNWICHMNKVLWKCCELLDDLKPEVASDMKLVLLYLHFLVSFTSTSTWTVLKSKNMEIFKSGMNQLCANLMGNLVNKGFYLILKVT